MRHPTRATAALLFGFTCVVVLCASDWNVAELHDAAGTRAARIAFCVFVAAAAGALLVFTAIRHVRELRQELSKARSDADHARLQLHALIESASDVIAVLDKRGRIQFNSPSLSQFFDAPPRALLGKSLHQIVLVDDHPSVDRFLETVRTKGSARIAFRLATASGAIRNMEGVGKDRRGHEAIRGIVVNAWDVTDRNAARASLTEEKERALVTLRSMGEGVLSADANGRVVLMNHAAERMTGWPLREARGKPLSDILRIKGDLGHSPPSFEVRQSLASTITTDFVLLTRSGEERLVAHAMALIRDEGKALGIVCVVRDVTVQRQLEREVIHAQQLESLGILAGGIAHDFNNLLSAILANTSLAREELGDHPVCDLLDEACKAAERAAALAHQLLTFSKGGAPVRTAAPLLEILKDSVTFVLRGSRASVQISVADDLDPALIDPAQISQVMQNLAINASQAMPNGGAVRVSANNVTLPAHNELDLPAGRYVRVSVQDEGCGIPAENLGRVFDPFFTSKSSGHGLGLATSRSIIRRHEGHIAVQSTPGSGTTFTIHLPASQLKTTPAALPANDRVPLHGLILVMDDDEIVRVSLVRILRRLGFETVECASGRQAVDCVTQAHRQGQVMAAVILDLTVPGDLGGLEILPSLRSILPDVPAIASSGYSTNEVMSDHAAYGFDAVLPKPYTAQRVRSVVHSVLSISHTTSMARGEGEPELRA